jgi:hypothetical protein
MPWLASDPLNTPVMMNALFGAARDTLELLSDTRYPGAQRGIQLALHTWTRAWICICISTHW